MGYSYDYAFRWIVIWSKVLRLEELMSLPLREDRADDNGEGGCGRGLSAYQPRSTASVAAWISAKTFNFCVMSRDQIIGMRKLEQWPNNGGLVMLPRAAI